MDMDDSLSHEILISKRLIEKLEKMLKDILNNDKDSLKIALDILDSYVKDGSSEVKSYISKLLEEELGDKA